MAKSLWSAFAAMALAQLAPTAAHAVTYSFDFTDTSTRISTSSGVGNSMIYKSTTNPSVQVKITAWSIDTKSSGSTDDIVTKATLALYSGGLGIQNKYEDGSAPNHSIDNGVDTVNGVQHNMVDFVLLQFDYDVDLNTFGTGWVSGDQDVSLRAGAGSIGNPSLWQNTPLYSNEPYNDGNAGTTTDLTNYLNISIANSLSSSGNPTSNRPVNSTNQHGMLWILGALYGSDNDDFFKLNALNVTLFPTVPEPSTWMTMILGFGFVGWTMRRKTLVTRNSASLA